MPKSNPSSARNPIHRTPMRMNQKSARSIVIPLLSLVPTQYAKASLSSSDPDAAGSS